MKGLSVVFSATLAIIALFGVVHATPAPIVTSPIVTSSALSSSCLLCDVIFSISFSVVIFYFFGLFLVFWQVKNGYFFEDFEGLKTRWVPSTATKKTANGETAKYDGEWGVELPTKYPGNGTKGLVVKSANKHHAVSALFDTPVVFDGTEDFVVQYEVKLTNIMNCGGAYLKLLSHVEGFTPETFDDQTPYTIMFGPDKCGDSNKVISEFM